MSSVVGWDIGGVHLKAARAEMQPLERAFAQARADMGQADHNVITMTGELADTFSSRKEGVERLTALAKSELGAISVYAGRAGYVQAAKPVSHAAYTSSANVHACASLMARKCPDALLIDMGSTTTDIVPIAAGQVAARGYTDAERLAAGELVYSGLV